MYKLVSALQTGKQEQSETACSAEDIACRAQLQNKFAVICEDLIAQVGAYPKCALYSDGRHEHY